MHSRTRAAPARLLPVGWWSPNRGFSAKTLALLATGLVRFCNDVPDQPTGRRRLFGRANIVTQSEGDSSSGRRALPTILVSIVWSTIWSNVMIPHRICQHGRRSSSTTTTITTDCSIKANILEQHKTFHRKASSTKTNDNKKLALGAFSLDEFLSGARTRKRWRNTHSYPQTNPRYAEGGRERERDRNRGKTHIPICEVILLYYV